MFSPPIIDLHEDISAYFQLHGMGEPLGPFSDDVTGRDTDIPKYKHANVKLVFASIFPATETFDPETSKKLESLYGKWLPSTIMRYPQTKIFEHFKIYYRLSNTYNLPIIETIDDVERVINEEGTMGLLLHIESADVLDVPSDLVLLKKLGLRSLGLTWNYNTKYGSACTSSKDYGLTPEGEDLIKTANDLNILLDLSHAGKQTLLDTLEISESPILVTHANIRQFVDTPRNLDDELLEALDTHNGVIGISVIGPLITKQEPTIDDLVKHFMYIYEHYGPDILAIGTDFHGLLGLPAPKGLQSIDKLPNLFSKLAEKGLSKNEIELIAYKNALRVIKENFS